MTTPVVTWVRGPDRCARGKKGVRHVDGLVAISYRNQHRSPPRTAHGCTHRRRVHPSRVAHRDGRPRDSGGDRGLQPPRGGELCDGGSLPVGLCNDNRSGHCLPGPNGQPTPGAAGSATVTDSDLGTAPGFTPGAAPSGVNAARAGGELLVSGETSPNLGGTSNEGPWLKEAPENPGSYTIWVANDGSGMVQVLDAAGQVPVGATHTAKDCSAVSAGGPATTTTTLAPTTTTTTTPPTTTTTIGNHHWDDKRPRALRRPPQPRRPTTRRPLSPATMEPPSAYGVFGSFTVTASGSPQPSLKVSGSLPSGVSFDRTTGVLSGTRRSQASTD